MTKDELYRKLIDAHHRHQSRNTKCVSYVDCVIKIVKEYLDSKDVQLAMTIDQAMIDYFTNDVKHTKALEEWYNKKSELIEL
jgi:hypothetical protein